MLPQTSAPLAGVTGGRCVLPLIKGPRDGDTTSPKNSENDSMSSVGDVLSSSKILA